MSKNKKGCLQCEKEVKHDDPFVVIPKTKNSKTIVFCSPHCRQRHEHPRCSGCRNQRPRSKMLTVSDIGSDLFCSDHCINVRLGKKTPKPAAKLGWYCIERLYFQDEISLRVKLQNESFFRPNLPAFLKLKQVIDGPRLLTLYKKAVEISTGLPFRFGPQVGMALIWKLDAVEPMEKKNGA